MATMELGDYATTLRKRWILIVACALLGALGGLGYTQAVTPLYRSTASVFVSLERSETVSELMQGASYTRDLVTSYAALATLPAVLDPVIDDLELDTTSRSLATRVTAMVPIDTTIIEIASVDGDPVLAAEVANAAAASLAKTVDRVSPADATGDSTVQVTVVSPAQPADYAYTPNTRLLVAVGGAAGLALGVVLAVLLALLDTRIRTANDLPKASALTVLGAVPYIRTQAGDSDILMESYRRLRTNIQFLDVGTPVRSFVITSSVQGEGKSTTAINLAQTLAETGSRVLLVDADLRRPTLADRLGLEAAAGLSTILIGRATLEDVVQPYGMTSLFVLTAGDVPPNPGQLVESAAMAALIEEATEKYDVVLLDVPPLLPVTDGAILARHTQGAVVVARAKRVRRTQLTDSLDTLKAVDATCLGIVVNGVARSDQVFDRYASKKPATRRLA